MHTLRPYEMLARVYDDHWGGCAAASSSFLDKYFQDTAFPSSMLDLGCGTGALLAALAARIARGVGMDNSNEMLAVARKKCARHRHITFLNGDFREFSCPGAFDLVTCCCDSVNYAATVPELGGLFRGVAAHLSDRGIFVFDFLNARCFQERSGVSGHCEGNGIDYEFSFHYDPERRRGRSRFRFRYGEEEHVQTPHEPCVVRETLQDAGLAVRAEYGEFDMGPPAEDKRCVFVVERRAGAME